MNLNTLITDSEISVARFSGPAAVNEHRQHALAHDRAVRQFACYGAADEGAVIDFQIALEALGFDRKEVEWHVGRPGEKMACGYVSMEDTP